MYNPIPKASVEPKDVLLRANCHLGIPDDKNELPTLSGWQEIEPESATKQICLTQGDFNVLTLYQYELPMGILWLPPGAGRGEKHRWIQAEYENLKVYDTIYLCFNNDEEGQRAVADVSQRLGAHKCPVVRLPHKDAHSCVLEGVTKEVIHKCFSDAKTIDPAELRRACEYADKIKRGINHLTESELGYALPWDRAFGTINFRPGELTVWTGINGHGKSQLLGHLMLDQIQEGASVCIASMELAPVKTLIRMARQASGLKAPLDTHIERICQWWGNRLWLFDLIGTAKAERLVEVFTYARQRYGVDVFVIDSLMKCGFADDDYAGQKKFLDQLSDFKNQFNCHVHVVAHPKKAQDENTPPSKLDIKGVSGITDLADNCMSVWRNKPKEDKINMDKGKGMEVLAKDLRRADCQLKCTKQRFGDWEGIIPLWFDRDSFQYLGRYGEKPKQMVDYSRVNLVKLPNDFESSGVF